MTAPTLQDLPYPPPGRRGWPWTEAPPPLPPKMPDGRDWPAIGIVTPSFNQGRYIEETIRSVLLQGYPALEYHIEDGGSTDETVGIIRRYEKFLSGWVSEKDRGQSHAINKGMARLQRAEWINWLNSDDILLPGALDAVGRWSAKSSGECIAAIGLGEQLLERTQQIIPTAPRSDLDRTSVRNWRTHAFLQPACFFRRDAFLKAGGLNEALHYALDFELWLKLAEIGDFGRIDHPIARELLHADAKTQRAMGECYAEICEVLFTRGHNEEARRLIRQIYDEYDYVSGMIRPVTDNKLYQKFIRPMLRRAKAPDHLKP